MLYIVSHNNKIKNIFEQELKNNSFCVEVKVDSFNLNDSINATDILILDIDIFDSLKEVMSYFEKLPKILKVIGFIEKPQLSHGAFLIKKGFKSYIGTKTEKNIIDVVIESVSNGNVWLYPQLMNFIVEQLSLDTDDEKLSKVLDKLSQKEQDVAKLVSKGLSNKEIGKKLEVQLVTIKKHISNIFKKLEINDRLSLALLINK
jgi:DNA-binding NarL/FixJ family response regulator